MSKYRISIIQRPNDWNPVHPDDVPAEPGELIEAIADVDELFSAVRQAIEYNESSDRANDDRWAVVIEPGSLGKAWPAARLCTPVAYKIMALWWPSGWEPTTTMDVPNCVWKAQSETGREEYSYQKALTLVRSLNEQAMRTAGSMWYVMIAVENEPLSRTVSYDPSGVETTVKVRRLHVVRPGPDGGHGDCMKCPAHSFDCVRENWASLPQTDTATESRNLG